MATKLDRMAEDAATQGFISMLFGFCILAYIAFYLIGTLNLCIRCKPQELDEPLDLLHWMLKEGNAFFTTLYSYGVWIPASVATAAALHGWQMVETSA